MSNFNANVLSGTESNEELIDALSKLQKDLNFIFNRHISSKNIREIGNWLVGPDSFQARNGQVGISSFGTGVDDVRIWAGDSDMDTAPYRVYESGKLVASDAEITGMVTATSGVIGGWTIGTTKLSGAGILEGGTVRTADSGSDRISMSGGEFQGITASGNTTGLYFDIGAVAGTGIADLYLYHNGSPLLQFYDEITGYAIRPGSGANYMRLGVSGKNVQAGGNWFFNNSVDFSSASVTGLSINTVSNHTHGIPNGTELMKFDGTMIVFDSDGGHDHTIS